MFVKNKSNPDPHPPADRAGKPGSPAPVDKSGGEG